METVPAEPGTTGLPGAVAETHGAILEAAESGDADAVAALAGDEFTYSFGGAVEGGPGAYWRRLEAAGERPLEVLAAILRLPYTLTGGVYAWPFAYGGTADELTDHERSLLEQLPEGAAKQAEGATVFGPEGYLGWRAGITPDGEWLFFVAGD